jgi:FHA domain
MQTSSTSLRELVLSQIEKIYAVNSDFQEAYETYVAQYGKEKIDTSEPLNLVGTVDPATLILGRNCTIFYNDYSKTLKGSLGSLELKAGEVFIIGRREPQDSKLVVWGMRGGVELETYTARVGIIVSRLHAAIAYLNEKEVLFMDLGSSAGSVVAGDSVSKGAFVKVYDPGTERTPMIKLEKSFTTRTVS